jgi:trimeric autotransporter adhesin
MNNLKFIFFIILSFFVPMLIFTGCGPTQPNLIYITVTPTNPTISNGSALQFDAVGNYQDNDQADITTSVTWSSSNTLVSTISNTSGSQGLATAVSAGTTTITATDPSTKITGTAVLVVQ